MFSCPKCDKRYVKQNSLTRHIQNHRKTTQYTCPTCNVVFSRRDLLSRHSKMHRRQPTPSDTAITDRQQENNGRQRCHTACIGCRESRTKCDGQMPCLTCNSSQKTCKYSPTANRISRAPIHNSRSGTGSSPRDPSQEQNATFHDIHDSVSKSPYDNSTFSVTQPEFQDNEDPIFNNILPSPLSLPESVSIVSTGASRTYQSDLSDPFNQTTQMSDFDQDPSNIAILPSLEDLASDSTAWPWLHENMFLQTEWTGFWTDAENRDPIITSKGVLSETLEDEIFVSQSKGYLGLNRSANLLNLPNRLSASAEMLRQGAEENNSSSPLTQGMNFSNIGLRKQVSERQVSEQLNTKQANVVEEVIVHVAQSSSFPESKASRAICWAFWSTRVQEVFNVGNGHLESGPHVLQHFVDLYLLHFGPLWPLLSRQNLDCDLLHPILYLTLTSIGAMYGGKQSANFGTMMHNRIRQTLTNPLELGDLDDDMMWLGQARLLTQVAALYFGQSRAFSYAQHLGGLLVAQARRMNLFSTPRNRTDDLQSETPQPASERLARWLSLEARRRLAFGILRAETYTSVLLNTRPLVSPEEIDLELPSVDSIWRGKELQPDIFLGIIEQIQSCQRKRYFSDIIRIAYERAEVASVLEPIEHELLLFGLQHSVWRFSHDHGLLQRLTGKSEIFLKPEYAGLDSIPDLLQNDINSTNSDSASRSSAGSSSWLNDDHLGNSPLRMQDLKVDVDRLMNALRKWKVSFEFIRPMTHLEQDRNSLLSSLLLYHLSYLRLRAPIEDLHHIS